jgi:hypothetical protein
MFKKLGLLGLVLGTVLTFAPNQAQARDHEREHHRHRVRVMVGVGPRHYVDGYYDRWGYWHPYARGFYDRRGVWHRY